jgi:hypothetical protein
MLGVLLDAVSVGLKQLPHTRLGKLPRMADFALFATACETALWSAGNFWSAYCGNRDEAVEGVIEADPVAAAVCAMMRTVPTVWTGNATDLLGALAVKAGERITKSKAWPDSPRALSGRLRRAATFLRKIGIEISFERQGRARTRIISISGTARFAAAENREETSSAPSAPSALEPKASPVNGFVALSMRTEANDADGTSVGPAPTVRANPLKLNAGNGADGVDANYAPQSAREKTRAFPAGFEELPIFPDDFGNNGGA